jgi:hypothetical protein
VRARSEFNGLVPCQSAFGRLLKLDDSARRRHEPPTARPCARFATAPGAGQRQCNSLDDERIPDAEVRGPREA